MPKQGVKNKKYNDKDKEDKEIKVKKKNFLTFAFHKTINLNRRST